MRSLSAIMDNKSTVPNVLCKRSTVCLKTALASLAGTDSRNLGTDSMQNFTGKSTVFEPLRILRELGSRGAVQSSASDAGEPDSLRAQLLEQRAIGRR
jgi:hypothetical protein